MLQENEVRVGATYQNAKGIRRRVISFRGHRDELLDKQIEVANAPVFVEYEVVGAKNPTPKKCYMPTFVTWATNEVSSDEV